MIGKWIKKLIKTYCIFHTYHVCSREFSIFADGKSKFSDTPIFPHQLLKSQGSQFFMIESPHSPLTLSNLPSLLQLYHYIDYIPSFPPNLIHYCCNYPIISHHYCCNYPNIFQTVTLPWRWSQIPQCTRAM